MNTVDDMRASVFFEGPEVRSKVSRFWILLVLAATIAAAGVVADSTATVIGAMIVAPLMTPILGVVLATVIGARASLVRSWLFVLGGAGTAVAIGYAVGLIVVPPVVAATNSQVSGRVTPGLIDLLAALATGVVGSIALVRRDISDTLPGVAIAISLVPPLTVVGLTMESGAWSEAAGALLLFVTNVAAILATGVVVLAFYRIGGRARGEVGTHERAAWGRQHRAYTTIAVVLVVVGVPLAISSARFTQQSVLELSVQRVTSSWADDVGWEVAGLVAEGDGVVVQLTGPMPAPDLDGLVAALEDEGVEPDRVTVELIPAYETNLGDQAADGG